jgi:UDP-perosamine 4-acetyltransferase
MPVPRCVVLGAGGHARVVVHALRLRGVEIVGLLDPDPVRRGGAVDGAPVLGGDELLPDLHRRGTTHFAVGLGGILDLGPRARLFALGKAAGPEPLSVIHPAAVVWDPTALGAGVQVLALAAVNSGARVGENAIVNTGAIVEHDCLVGAHAHLATGVRLAGGVTVEEGAFVGAGAVVRNGLTIGRGAVVGMGAVVLEDVPAGARVAGNPARRLGGPPSP